MPGEGWLDVGEGGGLNENGQHIGSQGVVLSGGVALWE